MEETINQVILKGKVGAVRTMLINGVRIANFSLYTSTTQRIGDDIVEEGVWHYVVAKETDGISLDNICKGAEFIVHGRLRLSKYTSTDGTEKVFTEVLANHLECADKYVEIHTVITESLDSKGEFSADAHAYGSEKEAQEHLVQEIATFADDKQMDIDPYSCTELKGDDWWFRVRIIKDTVKIS